MRNGITCYVSTYLLENTMTLYKNKYRIESTRLPNYDYSANGFYFVTICTHKKHCYFGKIVNAQMQLSQVGKIAQKHWQEIPNHFDGVYIDKYVVMPNHVHGIIVINQPDKPCRDVACNVSTHNDHVYQKMSRFFIQLITLNVKFILSDVTLAVFGT